MRPHLYLVGGPQDTTAHDERDATDSLDVRGGAGTGSPYAGAEAATLAGVGTPGLIDTSDYWVGSDDTYEPRSPFAPVMALAKGAPITLTRSEVCWKTLVNATSALCAASALDPLAAAGQHTIAEVLVDDVLVRHGLMRDAGGARVAGIGSDLNRWLLPFLIETTAALPRRSRSIAGTTRNAYAALPLVLSGAQPLPAATVAADLLSSDGEVHLGAMCVWLPLDKAARVVLGGKEALAAAIAEGHLTTHRDVRDEKPLVHTAALRQLGLLIEPTEPHGLRKSTASNITTLLKNGAQHARDLGASVPGNWAFRAREPLAAQLQVRQRTPKRNVSFGEVARLCAHLPVIMQLTIWLETLLGVRISEGFGPLVLDFTRRDGVGYLALRRQSGHAMTTRDRDGQLVSVHSVDEMKTGESAREIPLPESLAQLIELFISIFHTDPETGLVNMQARLVPGLRNDDRAGDGAYRARLDTAIEAAGLDARFTPHALRGSLIEMLRRAGISKELRFRYVGHKEDRQDIQDKHYTYDVDPTTLIPVATAIEAELSRQVPVPHPAGTLVFPTTAREQFGTRTLHRRRRETTANTLYALGWWIDPPTVTDPDSDASVDRVDSDDTASSDTDAPMASDRGRLLSSSEIADRLGCAAVTARRMLREGQLPARQVAYGNRLVWKAYEADVEDHVRSQGCTIQQVADELGATYHQIYQLLIRLQLMPTRLHPGTPIRLTSDDLELVRAELRNCAEVHNQAVHVSRAAQLLHLSVTSVDTLIRQGKLTTVPAPNGARMRLIPLAEIAAFNEQHPHLGDAPGEEDSQDAMRFSEAARQLGLTRNALSALVTTRQVRAVRKPGVRHQYISAASVAEFQERESRRTQGR